MPRQHDDRGAAREREPSRRPQDRRDPVAEGPVVERIPHGDFAEYETAGEHAHFRVWLSWWKFLVLVTAPLVVFASLLWQVHLLSEDLDDASISLQQTLAVEKCVVSLLFVPVEARVEFLPAETVAEECPGLSPEEIRRLQQRAQQAEQARQIEEAQVEVGDLQE